MKLKIFELMLIFLGLFLFGCVTQNNSVDSNSLHNGESNSKNELVDLGYIGEGVFCKMDKEHKFYYEENYYNRDGVLGVTTQLYQKQTLMELKYFDKLKDAPPKVGTWGFATKDDFVVYSNADGECFAMRHSADINPFLMKEPIYYDFNFIGESKQIGGSEIGWKLRQRENLWEELSSKIITLADYINKDYCIPLVQDIVGSTDFTSHSEKVNFTREFDESVFELPEECKNVPIIDLTNVDYKGYEDYGGKSVEEDYGGENKYENACVNQCEKMREICKNSGLDVTSDGQGCYDPNKEYQRHCEYVCLSG